MYGNQFSHSARYAYFLLAAAQPNPLSNDRKGAHRKWERSNGKEERKNRIPQINICTHIQPHTATIRIHIWLRSTQHKEVMHFEILRWHAQNPATPREELLHNNSASSFCAEFTICCHVFGWRLLPPAAILSSCRFEWNCEHYCIELSWRGCL